MNETSGLANHAKENRINWSAPRKCTLGRKHIYINGICGCGKMTKREELKIHNETHREIDIYKLESENLKLRKIAAHIPPTVYLKAKEKAGYGDALTPKNQIGLGPSIADR